MSSEARVKMPRFNSLDFGLRAGAFRPNAFEVISTVVALLALSYVVYYYFTELRPARARLAAVRTRYNQQDATLTNPPSAPGSGPSRATQVAMARESLESFKNHQLQPLASGRRVMFDEINGLIKKYNLELTSGIQMEHGAKDENKKSSRENVASLFEVYPKVDLKFTAAGSYESLRKMLAELERSKQYVVLNGIDLGTLDQSEGHHNSRRRAPTGGQAVTLSVLLTAYFRPGA